MKEGIDQKFLYLPTNPEYHITDMLIDTTAAMQSAGKAPYLLMFEVERWDGPDSAIATIEHSLRETKNPVVQRRVSTRSVAQRS